MDEDLRQELDELRDEVRHLTHHVKKISKVGGAKAKLKAAEYWDQAHDEMSERFGDLSDTAKQKGDELDKYAKENPWQVAGAAAITGLFLGLLFSVRKRD
jgi:ElaB/YqjD/DUF883 family membrane-anchored ribosome-binding protein